MNHFAESMKRFGSVFPLVFATSWVGNLLLTGLAFYLGFTQAEPLTVGLLASVAGCILLGNALPIAVYAFDLYDQRSQIAAEETEASLVVREALRRSEAVLKRLEDAEGSIAKSLLLARQLPEKMLESQGSSDALLGALSALDTGQFKGLVDRLEKLQAKVASEGEGFEARLAELQVSMDEIRPLVKMLAEKVEEQQALQDAASAEKDEPGLESKLDLLQEAMEGLEDSLDQLLIQFGQSAVTAREEHEVEEEKQPRYASAGGSARDESGTQESDESVEDDPSSVVATKKAPKKRTATAAADKALPAVDQFEMGLSASEDDSRPLIEADCVQIRVKAMVGIQNRLYIRGDEPHLSWEAGQRMDLTGIGEFFKELRGVGEPLQVAFWLNDEQESERGVVQIEPGERYDFELGFERR